ncbi:hypothetical protein [Butyricimonas hominis]|mgnify:FL=1|jgi:hypothetical protein|uniref:Uncharacterized protein n=1 Tax=Butyricimonas hominis TaxID=2763032 RepID=A0ABR7CVL0_9BACT|nr:hypothetical protein [Butyricimonas hominis]MBC5619701.1 hypothetical protein [Butyricimonas hominis]
MDTAITNANSYWNVLKDLSREVKLDLIARLSNSLLQKEEGKKVSASSFYGVWHDNDFEDTDINEAIKTSRKFKDDIEAF